MSEIVDKTKNLLLSQQKYKSGIVSKMWPMTNKNLKEVHKLFDLNDKSVLTVTSSGDHILEAMLAGAKTVDSFDINLLTRYYFELKKAMIKTYKLKLYTDIIQSFSYGFISKKNYKKIRENLNKKYRKFWDEIIAYEYSNDSADLANLYNAIISPKHFNLVSYLSKENYLQLKTNLSDYNINFINSDLFSLDLKLDKTYDLIYLSNIYAYADKYTYSGIKKVKDYAKCRLFPYLNSGGTIVYAYLYQYNFDRIADSCCFRDEFEVFYPIDRDNNKSDCLFTLRR